MRVERPSGISDSTAAGGFGLLPFAFRRRRLRAGPGGLFHRGFDPGAVGFDESLQLLGGGQRREVAGNEKFVGHAGGGELDFGVVFIAAQQDADGRLLIGAGHVLFPPVQIKVHLADVAVTKRAGLEVEQNMATQMAVVENEVNVVVLVADGDAALAGLEKKAGAKFEEKFLQMIEQRRFEIALGVLGQFGEASEFENIGIADEVFDGFLRLLPPGAGDDAVLFLERPVRSNRREPIWRWSWRTDQLPLRHSFS